MLGKKPHVLQVAGRPAAHVSKGIFEVQCQPVDDLGTPAFTLLPLQNVTPNAAIQLHQFGVDCQRCTLPSLGNLRLELRQPLAVAIRQGHWGFTGG